MKGLLLEGSTSLNWDCVEVSLNFTSLDVVCSEHIDSARYVGMCEFVNGLMYIHSVKCLAHVKCYSYTCYAGGCVCLKPILMVLFMLSVELFLLKMCCV